MSDPNKEKGATEEGEKTRKIDVTVKHVYPEKKTATQTPTTTPPVLPPPSPSPEEALENYKKEMEEQTKKWGEEKTGFVKQIEELTSIKTKSEGQEKELEELKTKFAALAKEEFEGEKASILKLAKDSGLEEEKIKEIEEKITPETIDVTKVWITLLAEATQASEKATKEKTAEELAAEKEKEAEGIPPVSPPAGVVEMPTDQAVPTLPKEMKYVGEYEMLRDLYWKGYYARTTGDNPPVTPEQAAEARKKIKILWQTLSSKIVQTELAKRGLGGFYTFACPQCGNAVVSGTKCSKCGKEVPQHMLFEVPRR